ncbi:hypothetical protein HSX11_16990 [Oxalobacteraceae bacterium]|nr:hypothetical protein [Oxalobacteraceae bacterium]
MSQQINLFNPIFLKQKKVFGAVPLLQALAVILLGVVALGWFTSQRVAQLDARVAAGKLLVAEREARLLRTNAQFAPRKPDPALAAELAQAEAQLAALDHVEAMLRAGNLGNTAGYAEYFRALARQNVSGLWLTGVTIEGAGNNIGLQGRAMQPTLIPRFVARLGSEKIMRGKNFASLDIVRGEVTSVQVPAAAQLQPALDAATASAGPKVVGVTAAVAPAAAVNANAAAAPVNTAAQFVDFNLQTVVTEVGK